MDGTVTVEENVVKGRVIAIPEIDTTLTKEGYSADAKATGDRIGELARIVDDLEVSNASGIKYNNTHTGIGATDVQGAIDEIGLDALKKSTGGMVKGTVMVQNADNGYGSIMKNNSASADYGTQLADVSASGKTAKITVNALSDMLTYTDSNNEIKNIHHDGNKSVSSYTGNGSATSRVIDTKGIGKLLFVYGSSHVALVTPKGALVVTLSGGTIQWMGSNVAYYVDGKLTLATTNDAFNTSNGTYHYQVI